MLEVETISSPQETNALDSRSRPKFWVDVTPLSDARAWERELAELAELPANWDTYNSPPIQPAALSKAWRVLSLAEKFSMPEPQIYPASGGGVGIEWEVEDRALEAVILSDGQVRFMAAEGDACGPNQARFGHLAIWLISGDEFALGQCD